MKYGLIVLTLLIMSACGAPRTQTPDSIHEEWLAAMEVLDQETLEQLSPSTTEFEWMGIAETMERYLIDGEYLSSRLPDSNLGSLQEIHVAPCEANDPAAQCMSRWEFENLDLCFQLDQMQSDTWTVVRWDTTTPDQPTVYHRGDLAEAEPAVPGWTMPVDDLVPPAQDRD